MADVVRLTRKIAEGNEREVYLHPENADLLVKVMKPQREIGRKNRNTGELEYYRRVGARLGDRVPRLHGIIATQLGPGSVCDYVRDADGAVSLAVHDCVAAGRLEPAEAEAMLVEFFAWADVNGIALVTSSLSNFLCRFDGDGGRRLVMIDGFGPVAFNWRWRLRLLVPALVRLRNRKTHRRVMGNWRRWLEANRAGSAQAPIDQSAAATIRTPAAI